MQITELDVFARLVVASILGALVGFEREKHGQSAGLRTHTLVCVGSALITITSLKVATFSNQVDPSRIAAQIVTGIGFLGAGAILRLGLSIRGLTTAAGLWCIAGVGLAVGYGFYIPAVVTTIIVVVAVYGMEKMERILIGAKHLRTMKIYGKDKDSILEKVERLFASNKLQIQNLGFNKNISDKTIQITLTVRIPEEMDLDELSSKLSTITEIDRISVE
jgi:putative Mg2+ transporter-C (MgtC) family protein